MNLLSSDVRHWKGEWFLLVVCTAIFVSSCSHSSMCVSLSELLTLFGTDI